MRSINPRFTYLLTPLVHIVADGGWEVAEHWLLSCPKWELNPSAIFVHRGVNLDSVVFSRWQHHLSLRALIASMCYYCYVCSTRCVSCCSARLTRCFQSSSWNSQWSRRSRCHWTRQLQRRLQPLVQPPPRPLVLPRLPVQPPRLLVPPRLPVQPPRLLVPRGLLVQQSLLRRLNPSSVSVLGSPPPRLVCPSPLWRCHFSPSFILA